MNTIIQRGAAVDVQDEEGYTPLHFLMNQFSKQNSSHRALADSLILNGAKPNIRALNYIAPLHSAVTVGNVEAIRWAKTANVLLRDMHKELFDFNLPGGKNRWTPLHFAAYFGHYKVVEEILTSDEHI